jgi:hypothetical protein
MERTLTIAIAIAIAMRHAAEPAMSEPKLFFGSLLYGNLRLSTVFSPLCVTTTVLPSLSQRDSGPSRYSTKAETGCLQ